MDYTVDAVDKAVGLLFLVAQQPGLGVTELAKRSGNTKARAFRLLGTLEQSGLIQRPGDTATYSLGYKALFLGSAAQEQLNLVRLSKPIMADLGQRCMETVLVRVREGLETVCIARFDSPHGVRVHTEIGNRRHLYAGASGKLLLSYAPPDVQDAVLNGELERFTPNTPADRSTLEKEFEKIKAQGYSTSFAERTAETVAVAAPVRDAGGAVVAALSITCPSSRMSEDKLPTYIEYVKEGARRFSAELGYLG